MKKIILTLLLISFTKLSFCQVNFYKIVIGGGAGITKAFADLDERSTSFGAYAELGYNFTPFISGNLEGQIGQVKGGNIVTDRHNRQFTNDFKAFSINGKVALGQFIDYSRSNFLSVIKGFYLGTGAGLIYNDLTYVVRYKPGTETAYPPNGYYFPGKDKSTNLFVPVNVGMNFYFKDRNDNLRYIFNVNYQGNVTFGEGLDGYDDPQSIFKNHAPDIYTLFSVGLKYNFGPVGLAKRIF